MSFFEIFLIGVSLSCDAFAVAVSKGLSIKNIKLKQALIVGLYFGIFQALMPFLGYYFSKSIGVYLIKYNHLIAFFILTFIGVSMLKGEECESNAALDFKTMLPLAIGTSIDALAVGIAFTIFLDNIFPAISLIGITTFVLSSLGVLIGNKIKNVVKTDPKKIGGIILILIGLKMLLEFLF